MAEFIAFKVQVQSGPENIFLVVNPESAESLAIANAYIALRAIPPINVMMLPWKGSREETSVASFRTAILDPVLEAIEGLPEDEREVFDLVGIQGLTQAEVATVVGVSEKTVQRRLGRARLLLAEQLADLCPSTPGGPSPSPGETPPL